MNRRELLQLGAACLGGVPQAGRAAAAGAWVVRVGAVRQVLAPGLAGSSLRMDVLTRGSGGDDVPVVWHNATARPLTLRSAGADRDLRLAPGAADVCRLQLGSRGITIRLDDGRHVARSVLSPADAGGDTAEAAYAWPVNHWAVAGDDAPHLATLGAQLRAASTPLMVRAGQRLRFRFFHAGAGRAVSLHLPGHVFEVQSLDGEPLPRPVPVAHLELAPGERIDAQVTMQTPGRWVLGSLSRLEQQAGFGRRIDYAGARGVPVAPVPAPVRGDAARFARPADPTRADRSAQQDIVLEDAAWNRRALPAEPGTPQRLVFSNLTRELQVVALRGHRYELLQSGSTHVHGLLRDTLPLPPFARVAVRIVPRTRGVELLQL